MLANHSRALFLLTGVVEAAPATTQRVVLREVVRTYSELIATHPEGWRPHAFYWKNLGMAYHKLAHLSSSDGATAERDRGTMLMAAAAAFRQASVTQCCMHAML